MSHALYIVVSAACILMIAYRFYGIFFVKKVLQADDRETTPSHALADGRNYVPTKKWVNAGQHFAAIAAAGPLVGPVLFNNPPITYLAIILVFTVHYVLFHTRWGLRTRAVGEHPRAADTVGINVFRIRYINVILAGAIAGLGGAFLTLEGVGSFERLMTNGRGFLALAIMIFGKWTPLGAWAGALLFGFLYALNTQLQFSGVGLPPQLIGSLPYLATILVLAGFVGRSRAPAASGQPYETEG